MFKRVIAIMTMFAVGMLCILLLKTTPSQVGPVGVLGFFVLLYMAVLGALTFLFFGLGVGLRKMVPERPGSRKVSFRKSYYYASVVALVPVMLIALQSVSRVGVPQVALMILFVAVALVYISRRTT